MTHVQQIINWFHVRGGTATLREILTSGEPWSHEFNARKTNLRQKTEYDLVLERGRCASDNRYKLVNKSLAPASNLV
jgi:hypothetical protein